MEKQVEEYFLGIDLSTQALKYMIVQLPEGKIHLQQKFNFEQHLSKYMTKAGVYLEPGGRVQSNTYMFLEALDMMLNAIQQKASAYIKKIIAISFSAQQHGSIYYRKNAEKEVLMKQKLNTNQLLNQFYFQNQAFSRERCPIWMDSSTTKQCKLMENQVGSADKVAEITGSRTFERFTGSQILKIAQEEPSVYNETEHISLISSFLVEVFIGQYAQIDYSDASGMNLMNIKTKKWDQNMLQIISNNNSQDLFQKLNGNPASSVKSYGKIDDYFQIKYGFDSNCQIIIGTGDNPSSLIGLGIFEPGELAISLGTSDTLFCLIDKENLRTSLKSHVFVSPVDADQQYMLLLCTKNGALVREKYKMELADNNWNTFNELIEKEEPGNSGNYGIFLQFPEIIPTINKFNFAYCVNEQGEYVEKFNKPGTTLRALIEGKIVSLKINAETFGTHDIKRVLVTGGGSKNQQILQIISDIFGVPVFAASDEQAEDSACFGSAIRAYWGYKIIQGKSDFIPLKNLFERNNLNIFNWSLMASPRKQYKNNYEDLCIKIRNLEQMLELKQIQQ